MCGLMSCSRGMEEEGILLRNGDRVQSISGKDRRAGLIREDAECRRLPLLLLQSRSLAVSATRRHASRCINEILQ